MRRRPMSRMAVCSAILFALALAPGAAPAEPIKIGIVPTFGPAPVYLAQERGYFAAEGVPAELVRFDSAQPVAVAIVSGSIDFGATAFTGGLYSLAAQGELRIIAGLARESPGFHNFAYIVSNRAYASGFVSLKDFPGHSVATTQIGSSGHYALALLIEKYGFDATSLRLIPLQSLTNMRSAISGNQVDAAVTTGASALVVLARGDAKLLGWVGDETPWQQQAGFTGARMADGRRDTVDRFLRALREGSRDYHDAFIGPDGKRRDGPAAREILAIIAKYVGQPIEQVEQALPYIDAEARLDVKDVLHQIAWYQSEHMLKGDIDANAIIDPRYVVPLPYP